jgi:hypothetical protein
MNAKRPTSTSKPALATPGKARPPAFSGQTRTLTMNGSKLTERYDGTQWIVIKVDPA